MSKAILLAVVALSALSLSVAAGAAIQIERPDGSLTNVADPELAAARDRVESRLGGVDWDGTRILLTSTAEQLGRSQAPDWAAAYAFPSRREIVVRLDRVGSYPYSSLTQILAHEMAHLAMYQLRGDGDIPRWFEEGLALSVGGEAGMRDHYHLSLALVFDPDLNLASVEELFYGGANDAQAAYALAGSFVRFLEVGTGPQLGREVLARMRAGSGFEAAIAEVTGSPLEDLQARWHRRAVFYHRWVPLVTSSATLWIGISVLAVLAYVRKRRQRLEAAARMEREEAALWLLESLARQDRIEDEELGPYGPH